MLILHERQREMDVALVAIEEAPKRETAAPPNPGTTVLRSYSSELDSDGSAPVTLRRHAVRSHARASRRVKSTHEGASAKGAQPKTLAAMGLSSERMPGQRFLHCARIRTASTHSSKRWWLVS